MGAEGAMFSFIHSWYPISIFLQNRNVITTMRLAYILCYIINTFDSRKKKIKPSNCVYGPRSGWETKKKNNRERAFARNIVCNG